jgi:hypothetical protein
MDDDEKYGIGNATQYPSGADRLDLENLPAFLSGADRLDLENLPDVLGSAGIPRGLLYGDEAYGPGMTGDQTSRYDRTLDLTGSKSLANIAASGNWSDLFKNIGGKALNFAGTNQGIMAILAAIAAAADRQRKSGGGAGERFAGPTPVTRTMTQGKYGPIARYAANGGLMQAYAQGGRVQMEDGGFVMTKKAVDGAGGPRGLASLVPGARMIGGQPDPTGRKDLTPAVIHGPNGQTPAKVSRGEAYVPKRVVNQNGGSQEMYALMNSLQRRA